LSVRTCRLRIGWILTKLFRSFSACFDRIANIGCQLTLYSKCGLCWSVDECRTWLRAREAIANDVDAPAVIAAVLVQGDVNYCPHDGAVGNVWEFFAGRAWWQAATDAWKILLATGDAVLRSLGLRGR
jgi:hypothetical protein